MRFERIWIEQCRATRATKQRFGAKDALDYLVGEKLRTFAKAAKKMRRSPASCHDFLRRSAGCSTNMSSLVT